MKSTISYLFVFILSAMLLQSCTKKQTMPELRESYGYKDTKPLGGFVAYSLLQRSYGGEKIEVTKDAFGESYDKDYDSKSLYINVSRNFYATEKDGESLLDYVYKGNTAFIASSNIDSAFLNRLYCKQSNSNLLEMMQPAKLGNTTVRLVEAIDPKKDVFSYYFFPFRSSFPEINSSYARITGYNDAGQTNFFVFFWGKGRLYLHSDPRAFSNYFLLTGKNYLYLQHILEMLPEAPEKVYWDNYYNKKNYVSKNGSDSNDDFSTLGTIMKYPALARAFWIGLILLLLYILFNSKRRQRIVPVVKKPENTSIAFAEAIAGLYMNAKDNKLIAEKMITYFNEFIRTKYFITTGIQDPAYADLLSRKSGVPLETTAALVKEIAGVTENEKVSDGQLLVLNGLIEKFYKNKA